MTNTRLIIFIITTIIMTLIFIKNFNKWTTTYRAHQIKTFTEYYGNSMGWGKPMGNFTVKVFITFWFIMAVLAALIVISTIGKS